MYSQRKKDSKEKRFKAKIVTNDDVTIILHTKPFFSMKVRHYSLNQAEIRLSYIQTLQ